MFMIAQFWGNLQFFSENFDKKILYNMLNYFYAKIQAIQARKFNAVVFCSLLPYFCQSISERNIATNKFQFVIFWGDSKMLRQQLRE